MSRVFLVHDGAAVFDRNGARALAGDLREAGHELACSWELGGISGGMVAAVEATARWADRLVLFEAGGWWPNSDGPGWPAAVARRVRAGGDDLALVGAIGPELTLDVRGFELPQDRAQLLAWLDGEDPLAAARSGLGRPRWPRQPFRALVDAVTKSVSVAVHHARDRGQLVWICGPAGTGKSCALAWWLQRREQSNHPVPCWVVDAGLEWTWDLDQMALALAKAAAAEPEPASVADALARPRPLPVIVAIDNFDRLVDVLDEAGWARLAELLADLPPGLVVVATSRKLAPRLPGIEATIDLDRPIWRERGAAFVREMVEEAALGDRAQLVIEAAGANLQLASELIDALQRGERPPSAVQGSTGCGLELTPMFAAGLERSWTRMLARVGPASAALFDGLSLLCAAAEPLPAALLHAALGSQAPAVLLDVGAEWLHSSDGQVELFHPFVRQFLDAELGSITQAHARLDDSLGMLVRAGASEAKVVEYAQAHRETHRLAYQGLDPELRWVFDVERLIRLAGEGRLLGELERAQVQPSDAVYIGHLTDVARRHEQRLREEPGRLAVHLSTELSAHGLGKDWQDQLSWGEQRPAICLRNRLEWADPSIRVVAEGVNVTSCALDGKAERALLGGISGLSLWSMSTAALVAEFECEGWVRSCAITADGLRGVISHGRIVELYDLDALAKIGAHDRHGGDVDCVAISADGRRVLSGDEQGNVFVWHLDGDRARRIGGQGGSVTNCAITADGSLGISVSDNERVMVWDLDRDRELHDLGGHTYDINAVAITPDGSLAASVSLDRVIIWSPREGKQLHDYPQMGISSRDCALVPGPEGVELLVAESGRTVFRWLVADGRALGHQLAHSDSMDGLGATPDGTHYLTCAGREGVRLWQRDRTSASPNESRPITALTAAADGHSVWISNGSEGVVRVRLSDGERLEQRGGWITHDVVELGDKLLCVGSRHYVEVFELGREGEPQTWGKSEDWLRACAVEPGGRRVAFAGDDGKLYGVDDRGTPLFASKISSDWVRCLAWAGRNRLVSADDDGLVQLWALDDDELRRVFEWKPTDTRAILAMAVDRAGRRVAVGGRRETIQVLDLDGGEKLCDLTGFTDDIAGLAWARDDALVSAGEDGCVRIWSVTDGQQSVRQLAIFDAPYALTRVLVLGEDIVVGDAAGNYLWLTVDWTRILPSP